MQLPLRKRNTFPAVALLGDLGFTDVGASFAGAAFRLFNRIREVSADSQLSVVENYRAAQAGDAPGNLCRWVRECPAHVGWADAFSRGMGDGENPLMYSSSAGSSASGAGGW